MYVLYDFGAPVFPERGLKFPHIFYYYSMWRKTINYEIVIARSVFYYLFVMGDWNCFDWSVYILGQVN